MTWLAGDFYSSHRPVYNLPNRVRRSLFHLGCGVGVSVQREAGGVVAEGVGQGFYVYAVFQGQSRESMAEVMEAYMLRADGLQYLVVSMPEGVGGEHRAGLGRR